MINDARYFLLVDSGMANAELMTKLCAARLGRNRSHFACDGFAQTPVQYVTGANQPNYSVDNYPTLFHDTARPRFWVPLRQSEATHFLTRYCHLRELFEDKNGEAASYRSGGQRFV